ncbi:MAG: type IV pilin N-terminal domain-containing protein [Alphaproteobacteria bacterium]|nr:type IV pilin N-terminal domain-containing protein [Alphaproteobacteria bacterium]
MVAVTVILSAIIAAFVFGMAGQIQTTHMVAATEQRTSTSTVTVTYMGGQDAKLLQGLGVTVDTNTTVDWFNASGTNGVSVGAIKTVPASNPGRNYIVVTGVFTDGSTQVIAQNTL